MAEPFVLQRVEFATGVERASLYHRGERDDEILDLLSEDGESLAVPRGVSASFDTYFGAFPERSWFTNSGLDTVDLEVRVRGDGVLRVRRETPQGDRYDVHVEQLTDESHVRVRIARDDPFRAEAGRVWFDVEASGDVDVLDARWTTDDPPVREVRANVVFCTFNRLPYLREVIAAMAVHRSLAESIAQVTVVNQGDHFELADFPAAVGTRLGEKIDIIEQENLGGCGGFSRGMWETIRDPELTHVILLDDDIELHAESMARAVAFLSFARDSVALGGQMLDLFDPTHLYEAGAELDAGNLLPRPILHDLDLAEPTAGGELMRAPDPDYNGWWFFALAAEDIRQVGLPLPSFIRGDDIEFGLRLKQGGVRTVTMQGVGVWHEPFYAKLGGWHQFFENRNLLAMASLRNVGDWKSLRRHLLRSFFGNIMRSRYHSAAFTVMAMEDFLSGAAACVQTTDAALRRCLSVTAEIGPDIIDHDAPAPMSPVEVKKSRRPSALERRIAFLLRAPRRFLMILRRLRGESVAPDGAPVRMANDPVWSLGGLDAYVVALGNGTAARFVRDPARERGLWRRFLQAWIQVKPNADLVGLERDGIRPWQPYWDDMFGNGPERTP